MTRRRHRAKHVSPARGSAKGGLLFLSLRLAFHFLSVKSVQRAWDWLSGYADIDVVADSGVNGQVHT